MAVKDKDNNSSRKLKEIKIQKTKDYTDGMIAAMEGIPLANFDNQNKSKHFWAGYKRYIMSYNHRQQQALGTRRQEERIQSM